MGGLSTSSMHSSTDFVGVGDWCGFCGSTLRVEFLQYCIQNLRMAWYLLGFDGNISPRVKKYEPSWSSCSNLDVFLARFMS